MTKYKAVPFDPKSRTAVCKTGRVDRWCIINEETGEVVDNAQGYGYRTPQKAYAGWGYKSRDKSKDLEKAITSRKAKAWLKEHKNFFESMDTIAFEIAKGSWGPNEKFNAALVARMLKEHDLEAPVTAGELIRAWEKM